MGVKSKLTGRAYMILIFIFLYAPIALLMIFSFNDSKNRAVWGGFTLKWYKALFTNEQIIAAVKVTLSVGVLSSIIATCIATTACLGIAFMRKKHSNFLLEANNLPLMAPDIIMGVSLMLLFIFLANVLHMEAFRMSYLTLLLSHITFNIPIVVLAVIPKMRQMDKTLYEAALDLGASSVYALRKVIFPQILPGIVTGLIMAFTISIDDVVVSYFTSGPRSQTLGVLIFAMTKKRISPEINALSTVMFICVLTLLIIVNVRESRQGINNKRMIQF